jgi:hypothetical protein
MNIFVYDEFLKTSIKRVKIIENTLNSLGLNGKIIYCSANINNSLQIDILNGARTIIAVGNNITLHKTINAALKNNSNKDGLIFGIIPVGENNSLAKSLGVNDEKSACQIILARRLEKIDLCRADDEYFLETAEIDAHGTAIKVNNCDLTANLDGKIVISNICSTKNKSSDPQDGYLEILINGRKNNNNLLKTKQIFIENSNNLPILLDNAISINSPAAISTGQEKANFIVGKDRYFGNIN